MIEQAASELGGAVAPDVADGASPIAAVVPDLAATRTQIRTNFLVQAQNGLDDLTLNGWLKDKKVAKILERLSPTDDAPFVELSAALTDIEDNLDPKPRPKKDKGGTAVSDGGSHGVAAQAAAMTAGTPGLINVNFGGGCCGAANQKSGPAAIGSAGDYWNNVLNASSALNLPLNGSGSTASDVKLDLDNAAGLWGNSCGDPMYDVYIYPSGVGNATVTLKGLEAGSYELYVYGHGAAVNQPGSYDVLVGGAFRGHLETSTSTICGTLWQEGVQYVVFRNLAVGAGQNLTINVLKAPTYAIINGFQLRKTSSGPGNQPPSVALTSPGAGATFTAPANIALAATASDPDGTIAKVEFLQNGNPLATVTAAPYSVVWPSVAAGSYSLTARATDNAGATTTSAAVNVQVNGAPPPSGNGQVISVNFGGLCCGPVSDKTGPAAVGGAGDRWNNVLNTAGSATTPLVWTGGGSSGASLTLQNAPGLWGNACGDPMYDLYIYPYSGNATVTVSSLPEGRYDWYVYGHGAATSQNGRYELAAGGVSLGTKETGTATICGTLWQEGVQYVVFRDVLVSAGQTAVLTVKPGIGGYAIVNGLQIVQKTANPDSDNDGLPDAWELQYLGTLAENGSGDRDADGLTNAQEFALGTNPALADSDGNGVPDGEEDFDRDLLSNRAELNTYATYALNPRNAHTRSVSRKDGEWLTLASPGEANRFSLSLPVVNGANLRFTLSGTMANEPMDLYQVGSLTPGDTQNYWRAVLHVITDGSGYAVLEVPNLGGGSAYFTAGTSKDDDGDGLPNAYETLITGSSPTNPDSNFDRNRDGIPDTPLRAGDGVLDGDEDADGDAVPNRAEFALGTDPGRSDNPLNPIGLANGTILSGRNAWPTGIRLAPGSSLPALGLYASVDGEASKDVAFDASADGTVRVSWETPRLPNGPHTLQLHAQLEDSLDVAGSAWTVQLDNPIWFPGDLGIVGDLFYVEARSKHAGGTWALQLYDEYGNLVVSGGGVIDADGRCKPNATWPVNGFSLVMGELNALPHGSIVNPAVLGDPGLWAQIPYPHVFVDDNGVPYQSAYYTQVLTTFPRVAPQGPGSAQPAQVTIPVWREPTWRHPTKFAVAYMRHYTPTTQAAQQVDTMMQAIWSAADATKGVVNGSLNQPFLLDSPQAWGQFRADLTTIQAGQKVVRNLYYFGHGAPGLMGRKNILGQQINAEDLKQTLLNVKVGEPLQTINTHAFRFVFIDGCLTANGDLPTAFGIPKIQGMTALQFQERGLRPRAYLGWKSGVVLGGGGAVTTYLLDHVTFVGALFDTWPKIDPATGRPYLLLDAIRAAALKGRTTQWPQVNNLVIYGADDMIYHDTQ